MPLTSIVIKNLSFDCTASKLDEMFSFYGDVNRVTVPVDVSGRNRGFGFVEMLHQHEAETAIHELDGCEMTGRILSVSRARPRRGP